MRKNLYELVADFEAAESELQRVVQTRISGSFKKLFKQDAEEFQALKNLEEIGASIGDTVGHCLTLAKSLRANRIDLGTRSDHLSDDFMRSEQRILERASYLQSLIARPEPASALTEPEGAPIEIQREV